VRRDSFGILRVRFPVARSNRFWAYGVLLGAALAALLWAGNCQAKMVTVGAALPMQVEEGIILGCRTCVLTDAGAMSGASDVSPVDGVILRWHLYEVDPDFGASYRLRVLSRQGQEYLGAGTSSPVLPLHPSAVEAFPTHLPIKAGQLIGLELQGEQSGVLFGKSSSAEPVLLEPAIADGGVGTPPSWWHEAWWGREAVFPFNAEILPSPVITGIGPIRGPPAGGNEITISGENFAEVTSVSFGSTEATYAVTSESELTATVPPGSAATSVPVSVVTAAGRAEAPASYAYEASPQSGGGPAPSMCVVPRLKDRRLKAVRKMLSREECQLGQVRKRHHATARSGRVKRQTPPPGTALPVGGRVEVTLGLDR
jgi:IPT/TIG domain-containing protein/PASTA domain-containing protein